MEQNTKWSKRAELYHKFRPRYPTEIMTFLRKNINIKSTDIVADIGSGTGISSLLFLENGNRVIGIEPNDAMRNCAKMLFKNNQNYNIVNATAESISLKNKVDIVLVAQALHWFNLKKFKIELKKIIKKNGYIIIMWNKRRDAGSPFLTDYEKFLQRFAVNYDVVRYQTVKSESGNISEEILNELVRPKKFQMHKFLNIQHFDFEGLKGRLLSSSYSLMPDDERYEEMIANLNKIFNDHQKKGKIKFEYDTIMYWAQC